MPTDDHSASLLQARLRGVIESSLDALITVDTEGFVLDLNPAAETTFGFSRAEAIGRDMADLIVPPSLRARYRADLERIKAGEPSRMLGHRIEISGRRRDGVEIPIELAVTRIDLPDGSPVFAAHLRDISDRKRTEASLLALQKELEDRVSRRTAALAASESSLRESQELFAKSFNSSPALMSIAALPSGAFIEVNAAFLRALDRTREEIIGRTTLDLDAWMDPKLRDRFFDQIAQQGYVRDFEAEFRARPDDIRVLLLTAERIEISGRPCILTVAVDITERRRRLEAEAALAAAERRYRNLFVNAVEGLYVSSLEGRFVAVNPALARMLGYESPEACMHAINHIGNEVYVDPNRRAAFFAKLADRDRVTDFESEVRRADGSTFWVSESVRAVRSPDGAVDRLEGVAVDITTRREAARALAQARDAADTANRAKSQFLASMSHELRTPLNGILGFTQILSRDPTLGVEQQQGVGIIHESAEHLLGLINDVLDLSKVEAGRLELHPESCDLRALLASVADLLTPRARAKGLTFTTAFADDLPPRVVIDTARLRQILLNLVGNAVKFTRQGSITLRASRVPGATDDRIGVRFCVLDTGCGLTEADRARLFEPFVQGEGALRQAEGTGLGLVISQRLVAAMGGRIEVDSTPGEGCRFWFKLDLEPGAETVAPFPASSPIIGYKGDRRRVLVVDDHAGNRDVLRGLLEPLGFIVTSVATGEAALESAAATPPDLVLMDLRMPGMGGLAAIQHLREQHPGGALRIVAVTASAFDFDRQEALAQGCDDFLPKPVRAEDLFNTTARLLNLTWTEGESAPSPAQLTTTPFSDLTVRPPAVEVAALHELALSGDVVALRARAEALARAHPEHQAFTASVLELAAQFRLKALRKLLEPLL